MGTRSDFTDVRKLLVLCGLSCLALPAFSKSVASRQVLSLDKWTYIQVDNQRGKWGDWDQPSWLKYFGLAMADVTGDGYKDIVAGRYFYRNPGGRPEIVLASGKGVFYFQVPENPEAGNWPRTRIPAETMDEGIGVGDIDGDGDIDVAAGREPGKKHMVIWYENPGDGRADWTGRLVSETAYSPDRIVIAEINGDSRPDIVVTEERYPGPNPDASLYWFERPDNPKNQTWKRHVVIAEYSLNNLNAADMDRDGDCDIITCEHKGPKGTQKLQIFENDGKGNLTEHIIDRGKESHLGALVADMDNDGSRSEI